jgi:hypothetical protein
MHGRALIARKTMLPCSAGRRGTLLHPKGCPGIHDGSFARHSRLANARVSHVTRAPRVNAAANSLAPDSFVMSLRRVRHSLPFVSLLPSFFTYARERIVPCVGGSREAANHSYSPALSRAAIKLHRMTDGRREHEEEWLKDGTRNR